MGASTCQRPQSLLNFMKVLQLSEFVLFTYRSRKRFSTTNKAPMTKGIKTVTLIPYLCLVARSPAFVGTPILACYVCKVCTLINGLGVNGACSRLQDCSMSHMSVLRPYIFLLFIFMIGIDRI